MSPTFRIIPYDDRYRDDMIFVVLSAKDALGRVPRLNEDLLDVRANYLARGDGFFLALDGEDRVAGCGGFSRIPGTDEAFLRGLPAPAVREARPEAAGHRLRAARSLRGRHARGRRPRRPGPPGRAPRPVV